MNTKDKKYTTSYYQGLRTALLNRARAGEEKLAEMGYQPVQKWIELKEMCLHATKAVDRAENALRLGKKLVPRATTLREDLAKLYDGHINSLMILALSIEEMCKNPEGADCIPITKRHLEAVH